MKNNVLVLTPRLPYPVIGGDKLRIYNVCKYLAGAGNDITLLSFVVDEKEAELAARHEAGRIFSKISTVVLKKRSSYMNALFGLLSRKPLQTHYYSSAEMALKVDRELGSRKYDAVLAHLIRMAPYVMNAARLPAGTRKVLEMTDALSLTYARSRDQKGKAWLGKIYTIEKERAERYELECLGKFDDVVVVSSVDRDHLLRAAGSSFESKVKVIPNGVSVSAQGGGGIPSSYDPDRLIFIGNMRTHQNTDAVMHFVRDIYPLIRKKRPGVKFRVIGCEPPRAIRALHGKDGIEVTGLVDDVRAYARDACAAVCPMRIGAGVQNKLLESMAMGIPSVTTSIGFEGIDAVPGEHLIVADSPDDFSQAVLNLMSDKDLRVSVGHNSRGLIGRKYGWETQLKPYLDIFKNR